MMTTNTRKIWIAGLIVLVASAVLNLVVRALAFAALDLPTEFQPLTPGPILIFTFIGVLGATIAFWLVARFSKNPVRAYYIVAIIALIISLVPDIGLITNPDTAAMPGATPAAAYVLMIFHVITAIVSVVVLTTYPVENRA